MHLVESGRLTLDAEVEAIVPGVLPKAAEPVRVRHLLQHSAGIPNPPPIRWVRPASRAAPDPDEFLRARFAHVRRLRFAPGSRSSYTNLGYLLLGAVIARASGRSFEECVQREVLEPLDMHATSFAVAEVGMATGHQRLVRGAGPLLRLALPPGLVDGRAGRFVTFRSFLVDGAPYGGLVGPVTDAARLLRLHAGGGELDGTRILSEESARLMRTISSLGKPYDVGLGWFRPSSEAGRAPAFVEHYGGGGGYHNLMRLYPESGVGVVVMGNSTAYDVDAVVEGLAAPWLADG